MGRIEWAGAARLLGWIIGVSFLLGAVLQLILAFELLGGPPDPEPEDFIDRVIGVYAWLQSRWPLQFIATAAFAIGFAALALLGPVIGRLADETDGRRGLVSGAFLVAGGIGLASQLLWLGVFPVATNPQYCDCGFRAEEIMSREMILQVATSVQRWTVVGAILLAVPGILAAGGLGFEAGMPASWRWLSFAIAVFSIALAALTVAALYPFDVLAVVLVAGLLNPIWAIWLAMRAPELWPTSPERADLNEV